MSEKPPPLRVIELRAENVKAIKAVSIRPDPGSPVVEITGANGQGKTSCLDAIWYALGGGAAIPAMPVRRGAAKAEVTLDLGEYKVTRRWSPSGGTYLDVQPPPGKGGPQAFLDTLIDKRRIAFDPLAFDRMKPADQRAALLETMGLGEALAKLDAERKGVYEERTGVGREAKYLEAQVAGLPQATPGTPAAEVSVAALGQELASAVALQRQADEHRATAARKRAEATAATQRAEGLKRQLDALKAEFSATVQRTTALIAEAQAADAAAAAVHVPETEPIRTRMGQAESVNAQVRAARQRAQAEQALAAKKAEADALTKRLEDVDTRKTALCAGASFPVPGLGFSETGVTLSGVPFEQASASERLKVGLGLALASNPRLKIVLIRDGSLLDEDSMALIRRTAQEHGAQVWIERVDASGSTGFAICDGELAGIDGTPQPGFESAPEPTQANTRQ